MRKTPYIILTIIALMALIAGGAWFAAATATEKVLAHWIDERRAEGWVAEYSSLNTAGFPNRLDTTIMDLRLSDPDTGIAWSAPEFQNLSLIYKPTHVIAVLPKTQVFGTPEGSHTILSDSFRASAQFVPAINLPIERSTIEIIGATITSDEGGDFGLEKVLMSIRETPDRQGHVYDFDVTVNGIRPDGTFMRRISRSGTFSDVVESAKVRATIRFDAPWDRYALERARPQPREIELTRLSAKWGRLSLSAKGVLVVTEGGRPNGEINIKAENWREMIAVAQAAGHLSPAVARTALRAGEMMARLSGSPNALDAVLRFERGMAYLGPVPIGSAPEIKLP